MASFGMAYSDLLYWVSLSWNNTLIMLWILWILPEFWQISFLVSNNVETCHHLLYFSWEFLMESEEGQIGLLFTFLTQRKVAWVTWGTLSPRHVTIISPVVVCGLVYILLPNMGASEDLWKHTSCRVLSYKYYFILGLWLS